jgi:autotransporter-associated beta strand protein
MNAIRFAGNYLTLADAKALTPDLFEAATSEAQADTMWHGEARAAAIENLAKFKMAEAIPIALGMQVVPTGYGWGSDHFRRSALNVLSSYGDAARWTLPALREEALTLDSTSSLYATLNTTIMNIEAAITSPTGGYNALAVANPQVVVTPVSAPKSITLSGSSCRGTAVTFSDVSTPAHGSLSGTAPNFVYSPDTGYTGPDRFTFKVSDTLTTSEVGTVSLIVGTAGTGLKGEYFDNTNFTNLKLTRTDAQVNFDWGTGSPDASIASDTFSVRWSGQLLVPETGNYTFSTLSSDGVRLFINGVLIIDSFVDQSTIWKDAVPVSLTAGQTVDLQLEYYENTGSAVAKLKWTGPSMGGLSGQLIAKEWLYDGTGIVDHTPYALAQSVTLVQNAPQAIVLTGSGVNLTPLTYSIVKKPLHGTLTGTAPNLTYTPADNYSGSDSFTFLVNNGTSNSTPSIVAISIWGTLPNSYFWTNAVNGNWSGSSWTNATGGLVTPAPSGNSSYILNFNQAGIYTASQDLNNNFVFNQINLAGKVTIDGSNNLSPMANGSLLPQINQNSNSQVTIRAPLNLTAMTTLGGSGGGQVDLPVRISGPGGLILNSPGTLKLFGFGPTSPNTYSGGTIVNAGMLQIGAYDDIAAASPNCINPAGTGPITLNRTGFIQFQRVNMVNAVTVNGGTLQIQNGYGATCSGPVTMNASPTVDTNNGPLTLSGNISGAGGFNKIGNNTLYLSGTNSFMGASFITAGTMQCDTATALGVGALNISSGAKVNLNFTGTRTIAALTFDGGTAVEPGTYGSSTSPAANQESGFFTGKGTITILPTTSVALSLTAGGSPSNLGSPLTFTAAVAGASPTGNVAFYAGSTLLGTSALNGSFQATFTTSSLAVGSHNIRARYAGNATNAAASSSTAVAVAITSVFASPPTNLFATPGYNPVPLTWTVSPGATSYKVKRASGSVGPYTTIGTSSVASYNDATAVNGTKYYYVVSAINGAGESANSSPVSVPPFTFNSGKDILSFVFPGLPTVNISGTNISVTVPFGTIVTALSPSFTLSTEATAGSISGSTRDFTTPQRYTITAEDQTTKDYTVTVTVNQLPVAIAQTVSVGFNNSKPITLSATDGNGDVLAYTIVTQPANGTLTGTLPDITYNPNTGYTGTDSFTFKVNDGYVDSVVATVSLIVNPPSFTWNNASAGNWSDDTKWSGGSNPMTSGPDACAINFNVSGSYNATNDLGAGLLINQLNLGGSTLTLTGNKLMFAASGAALASVNQNSQISAVIENELNLGVSTVFTGSGNGRVNVSGLISGSGGLTKSGPNTLQLYGIVPNTYSGGTIVNSGTLHLGVLIGGTSLIVINPLGTGPVTLNTGGTIQFDRVSASNALTVNGGTLFSPNGWGAGWTGPITLNANVICNIPSRLSCTNTVSGSGGIVKSGTGALILSGACSYSGHTTVSGGTLQLDSVNAGNNASTVTIAASGATLNLNFSGTDTVDQLFIGTSQMAAGVYKAIGSAAAGTPLAILTGTGTLTVSSGSATTFTTVTSNFNPAPPGSSVTFTATVTGSAPTGNVSFYNGSTLLATSALNGSFQTAFSTASLGVGSYVITASYAGNANNFASSSTALNQFITAASFDTWASDPTQKLTTGADRGATADPDKDGIPNLIEFALGGNPMVSSLPVLPSLSKSAGNWVFDYERSDLSLSPVTTQVVEYGSNLTGWTPVIIPTTSSGMVTITPGSPSDHVRVTLPTGSNKTFVRLRVSK